MNSAEANLKKEEDIKQQLCNELNLVVQQSAHAQLEKLEQLTLRLEQLGCRVRPKDAAPEASTYEGLDPASEKGRRAAERSAEPSGAPESAASTTMPDEPSTAANPDDARARRETVSGDRAVAIDATSEKSARPTPVKSTKNVSRMSAKQKGSRAGSTEGATPQADGKALNYTKYDNSNPFLTPRDDRRTNPFLETPSDRFSGFDS